MSITTFDLLSDELAVVRAITVPITTNVVVGGQSAIVDISTKDPYVQILESSTGIIEVQTTVLNVAVSSS